MFKYYILKPRNKGLMFNKLVGPKLYLNYAVGPIEVIQFV